MAYFHHVVLVSQISHQQRNDAAEQQMATGWGSLHDCNNNDF